MSFDEQLRRVFDAALAELTEVAQADAERARQQGIETGRAQGWEDGREQGYFEAAEAARSDAESLIAAAREEADGRAAANSAVLGRLLDGFRAIDRARSLSEILDTVAACAGREAPRTAVLLIRGDRIRGWRFIGFEHSFDASSFEAGLSDAGVLADAITRGTAVGSQDLPSFMPPGDGRSFAQPLDVAGVAVAVLYADGLDEGAAAGAVEQRLEALGRYGSRALEARTALKAALALVAHADPERSTENSREADDADTSARRYARLLVSEIKLYHEPAVVAGRRERDLVARLGGEIARARALYEQRVPQSVRMRAEYFRDELVRTLANGDATLLQLT